MPLAALLVLREGVLHPEGSRRGEVFSPAEIYPAPGVERFVDAPAPRMPAQATETAAVAR